MMSYTGVGTDFGFVDVVRMEINVVKSFAVHDFPGLHRLRNPGT